MQKQIKTAFDSIEQIEAIFLKLGPTLNYNEISELAVAIHELKSFVNEIKEKQNVQSNAAARVSGSRAKYRKFIVVANDNTHHPMKEWVNNNPPYEVYGNKISHEISRILVNNHNFRKVFNNETNEVVHYQP
jgi:hypothetical protein